MADFSFLAMPNIEGIVVVWYLRMIGSVLLFGVSIFFVLYFWLRYRRRQKSFAQAHEYDFTTQQLYKEMLIQKIFHASDTTKLVLFIEYVEKFITTKPYSDISTLLMTQGFTAENVQEMERVLYARGSLSPVFVKRIDELVRHHGGSK